MNAIVRHEAEISSTPNESHTVLCVGNVSAIGGGFSVEVDTATVAETHPSGAAAPVGWRARWNSSSTTTVRVWVVCAQP